MAEQLSLVTRNDFSDDMSTLDLLPLLDYEGWQMSIWDRVNSVDEALALHIKATSDDDLAAQVQALDAMILNADRFKNPIEPYGVWLRHQLDGESGARQALILQAKGDKALITGVQARDHYLKQYTLGLTRSGAWERDGAETREVNLVNAVGGMVNIGNMQGDISARFARVTFEDGQGGPAPFRDIYLGLRSNRLATAANFAPVWEAELGHVTGGAAIIDDEDATASGGQEIEYTETPTATAGAFSIVHPRVKPGGIVVTATIAGHDYEFADRWPPYAGTLTTEGAQATDELQADQFLDHAMPTPNTINFYADGLNFARDDGEGGIYQSLSQGHDTWLDVSGGGAFNATNTPIYPSTVTGHTSHLTEELDYRDDGMGALLYYADDSQIGTIDYETGLVEFTTPAGTTITMTYWADFTGAPGTIDYVTGEWDIPDVLVGDDIYATYEYGNLAIYFNYAAGTGQFREGYLYSAISALSVTYTGYHNKCVRVTFTDPTMQVRWYMSLSEVTEFISDQRGNMLVLARLKVSDGSTVCRVRLDSGYDGTTAFSKRGKVTVSGDDWALYSLGKIRRSDQAAQLSSLSDGSFRLQLAADRLSGTGTLDIDCLVLIPIDEGFIHIEARSDLGAGFYSVVITQSADDRVNVACVTSEGVPIYREIVPELTGGFPIGNDIHAIVAANRSQHISLLDDAIAMKFEVYPRWLTLRGAE